MIDLIIFILVTFAISYVISQSRITEEIRGWFKVGILHDFIHCPTCLSFWIGMGLHFIWTVTPFFVLSGLLALGSINILSRILAY